MNKRVVIIKGDNFTDLETFYDEIDNVLTKDLDFRTGHNLDAFNDLLRGGFGVYEPEESIKLVWTKFSISRMVLGQELIDVLIEIIVDHDNIEFVVTD